MTAQSRTGRKIGQLGGAHKATALLLAMQKPLADRIIRQFQDSDIRDLARAAIELPPIDPELFEQLVSELAKELESSSAIEGSESGASALLAGIVPEEEMNEIMGEISGQPSNQIWKKLAAVNNERIKDFIASEQPQVAAFLLSKLPSDKAAAILAKLDDDLRFDVSARLVQLGPISDAAILMLSERLEGELLRSASRSPGAKSDNHAVLGAVLNKLDRDQSSAILQRLTDELPKEAQRVRKFVFGFEDVGSLQQEDRAALFEQAPTDRLVLALRDCDPAIVGVVLESLSPRARRMISSELSNAVRVPPQVIMDARRAIADLALALAERSIITLPGGEASSEPLSQ